LHRKDRSNNNVKIHFTIFTIKLVGLGHTVLLVIFFYLDKDKSRTLEKQVEHSSTRDISRGLKIKVERSRQKKGLPKPDIALFRFYNNIFSGFIAKYFLLYYINTHPCTIPFITEVVKSVKNEMFNAYDPFLGINFIRYSQYQKIRKPNKLKVCWKRKT